MKYKVKKKIEEIVIDLQDGCVISITKDKVLDLTINGDMRDSFNLIQCEIKLINGITYNFKTRDAEMIRQMQDMLNA